MTIRTYIIGSFFGFLVSLGAFSGVVTQLNPERAGAVGYILFFISLFVALACGAALVGYIMRRLIIRRQFPAYTVRISLRQGVIISGFVSLLLFLQLLRLYRWWIAIVLIAFLASIELVFLSYGKSQVRHFEADQE